MTAGMRPSRPPKRLFSRLSAVGPVLLLAFAAAPACALDLLESYRLALQQDARHQASRAQNEESREALPQAYAQLLPNVSVSLSHSRNSTDRDSKGAAGQSVSDSYDYTSSNYVLSLRQPLYRKYNFAQYRQAKFRVEGADATLDASVQDLLVRVSGAYFEALMAQDDLALVQAQKEAFGAQVQAALRAFDAGQGTRTDIDDAQARYDMTLAEELEAGQNLDHTRRQLQVIVNQPVGHLASLDPARLLLQPPLPASAEEWIARGEAANPELRELRANVEVAREEMEKARAGHTPTVDLVAQRSNSQSENNVSIDTRYQTSLIGVQVSIPLFAGGYTTSQVRQAASGIERSERQYEARRREIALEIRKEFQGVTQGVMKVRAMELAQRSAAQAVVSNQKGFLAGTRSRVDILNAQQQHASASRDLAMARYEYVLAGIRLKGLVSALNEAAIESINVWLSSRAPSGGAL